MRKQVDSIHYNFHKYSSLPRWASVWHQLNHVLKAKPEMVIEIGPGPGIFRTLIENAGLSIFTVDIDRDLRPSVLADSSVLPFKDQSTDVSCCFQVLEHMPFEQSQAAIRELSRITRRSIILSLPDAKTCWPITLPLPGYGRLEILLPKIFFKPKEHIFNGEHYWEINKKNYELARVMKCIEQAAPAFSISTYRVHDNPYHRFFLLEKQ